jgi:hypothetical protein
MASSSSPQNGQKPTREKTVQNRWPHFRSFKITIASNFLLFLLFLLFVGLSSKNYLFVAGIWFSSGWA